MESERRREARLSQRRDCDRECCGIESTEQREVQFFLSEEEGIELGAAAKRASEVICEGDRGWHLKLQKTDTFMQMFQRLTSETSKVRDKYLHQMKLN